MRKITMLLVLLAFGGTAMAQVTVGGGLKVGLNVNTFATAFAGEPLIEPQAWNGGASEGLKVMELNLGALSGAFVEVMFSEKVGLQAELNFSGEGTGLIWTYDGEAISEWNTVTRFKMMNIPLLFKVNIKGVDAFAGIQIAKTNKITYLAGERSSDNKPLELAEDLWDTQYAKTSWTGIVVGASKEMEGFVLDGRLSFGPELGYDPDNSYSYTPVTFTLAVGYKLFGKRGAVSAGE